MNIEHFFTKSAVPFLKVDVNISSYTAYIHTSTPEQFVDIISNLPFVKRVAISSDCLTVYLKSSYRYSDCFPRDFTDAVFFIDCETQK